MAKCCLDEIFKQIIEEQVKILKMWQNMAKMENVAKMWHQGQKCGKCPKNVAIWQPWI